MTIPALSRKIHQADLKAAFKKAYSDIAQATSMIVTNNNGSFKYLYSNNNCFANTYKNYMSTLKMCRGITAEISGNCWHKTGGWRELDGGSMSETWESGRSGLVLTNGAILNFYDTNSSCSYAGHSDASGTFLTCSVILVDVNGFKAPNVVGEDIFQFYVQETELIPGGSQGTKYDISLYPCDTDNYGYSCAVKVLQGN